MRDLFITARSFIKCLNAFLKYRKATKDMNQKYPDATAEEIQREDTCIICREEMRPWAATNPPTGENVAANVPQIPISERTRAKKLPCGHVLHLGCLKSWLERQQVCPTCRRPVVERTVTIAQAARQAQANGAQPLAPGQLPLPPALPPRGARQQPNANGIRMMNLGPLRLAFGRAPLLPHEANAHNGAAVPNQAAEGLNIPPGARVYGLEIGGGPRNQPAANVHTLPHTMPHAGTADIETEISRLEARIQDELRRLALPRAELEVFRRMAQELQALRQLHPHPQQAQAPVPATPGTGLFQPTHPAIPHVGPASRHIAAPGSTAIPSGSPDLPAGVSIPEGWSLLPLQNAGRATLGFGHVQPSFGPATTAQAPPPAAGPSAPVDIPASRPALSVTHAPTPVWGAPRDDATTSAWQFPASTASAADENVVRQRPSADNLENIADSVSAGTVHDRSEAVPQADVSVPGTAETRGSTICTENGHGTFATKANHPHDEAQASRSEMISDSQNGSAVQGQSGELASPYTGGDATASERHKGKGRAATVEESADGEQ
jgi:E3 ubiquitin-protein ligase synoviolin